jgi:thioredoxin 1
MERGVLLLDLDEPSCGPCRMQLPILERLAKQFGPAITVAELNIDEAQDWAMRFQVESLPTVLLFRDGKLLRRFVGVQRRTRLAKAIEEAVGT